MSWTKTSPDGQLRNQIDYILYSQRWRCSIQSAYSLLVCSDFLFLHDSVWYIIYVFDNLCIFSSLSNVFVYNGSLWSLQAPSFNNTRDDSTHGHHQMVNTKIRLIIFFAADDGEALYSQQKTKLGVDCSSDHKLLIAKFRLKLKKVGKTTGSFRYDLNKIPYDYTVEVTNRFKGLDLIDRVPEEL